MAAVRYAMGTATTAEKAAYAKAAPARNGSRRRCSRGPTPIAARRPIDVAAVVVDFSWKDGEPRFVWIAAWCSPEMANNIYIYTSGLKAAPEQLSSIKERTFRGRESECLPKLGLSLFLRRNYYVTYIFYV